MSLPSGSRRSAIAIALALCSGAGLLFAQEQSATTISHQVRDVFERAAKAIVKIHGVDEHSEICGTGFFVDPTEHFTPHTRWEEKLVISLLNLMVRNTRRDNSWLIFAAGRPC